MIIYSEWQFKDKFFICIIYIIIKSFVYRRYIKTWYPKVLGVTDFEFEFKIFKQYIIGYIIGSYTCDNTEKKR